LDQLVLVQVHLLGLQPVLVLLLVLVQLQGLVLGELLLAGQDP